LPAVYAIPERVDGIGECERQIIYLRASRNPVNLALALLSELVVFPDLVRHIHSQKYA